MNLKLRYKIVTLAIVSALLPVVVMSIMTFLQKSRLYNVLEHEINRSSIDHLKLTARDFYKTCEIANTIMVDKVSRNIKVIEELLRNSGGLNLSPAETVRWDAVNQFSHEHMDITLPAMLIGTAPVEKNFDIRIESPVIDRLQQQTSSNYTIFQRMNERGDMLRIATNVVELSSGKRAVGTFIPAIEPDGKPNKVIETLMKGETYKGSAFVVDGCYITAYAPIKNSNGYIIGCAYAGVKVDAMTLVKDMIRSTKIGKSGYVAVVGGTGKNRGQYIVANDVSREGTNLLDSKDHNGNFFIRDMVDVAVKTPGEFHDINYAWKNSSDKNVRMKNAAYVYFAQWDWVILATMYLDDYSDVYNEVNDRINLLLMSIVIGGLIFLIAATMLAWYIGNRIGHPIARISEIAGMIAHGDLCSAMQGLRQLSHAVSDNGEINEKVLAKDETGMLIRAMTKMTCNLNSLVGEVQKATINLVSTSTEIAASSREQEVTVNELGASTNEIVSSTKEISSTSQQLVNTMTEVAATSNNAAELAEAGRAGLSKMGKSMEQLATATASISSKLAIINEKTSNINNVVATITKVADQTNLLSLNASIEAEKAGEYGKGFSVVAREIRRLADQTAIATLDIIKMVKEMQSAVSSGVMGMDKFSEEVRISVQETELINGQIEGIIREVQGLPVKFDMVIDGMKQQTLGAHQISDSMVQLSDCARSTSESLRAFNDAAGQLNSATMDLQKEVAIFKVK